MPIYKISEEVVKRITSEFPEIASLSLANNEIQVIENLNSLTFLRTIDLAYNKIELLDFQSFVSLQNLKELFLQYNQISQIKGSLQFSSKSKLEALDLSFNPLNSLQTLNPIASIKTLRKLFLTATPLSLSDEYRTVLVATFPQLEQLDGVDISRLPTPTPQQLPTTTLEDQGIQTTATTVSDADMQTAAVGSTTTSATQSKPHVVAPVSKEQLLAGRERIALRAREAELQLREDALLVHRSSLEEMEVDPEVKTAVGSEPVRISASTQAELPTVVAKVETQSCAVQADGAVASKPIATQTEARTYERVETQTELQSPKTSVLKAEASAQTVAAEVYASEVAKWKRMAQEAQEALMSSASAEEKQDTESAQTQTSRMVETRAAQTDALGSDEIDALNEVIAYKEKAQRMQAIVLKDGQRLRSVLLKRNAELKQALMKQKETAQLAKDDLSQAQAALVATNDKVRDQAETIKELMKTKVNPDKQDSAGRMVALEQLLRAQDRIFEMEGDPGSSKAFQAMKMWRDKVFELLVRERSSQLSNLEASRRARVKVQDAESRIEELVKGKTEILEDHSRTKRNVQDLRAELLRERSSLLSSQGQLRHVSDSVNLTLKALRRTAQNEEDRIFRRMLEASTRLCDLEIKATALKAILPEKLNALTASQSENNSLKAALEASQDDLKLSREQCASLEKELVQQKSILTEREVEVDLLKRKGTEREAQFSAELSRKLNALEDKLREARDSLRAERDEERTLRLRFEGEIRQVRRQLARQHDKYEQSENSKNVFMAEKLKRKDHEIQCLRRERNVLLSAMRGRNTGVTTPTSQDSSGRAGIRSSETTMEFSSVTSPRSDGQQGSVSDGSMGAHSPRQHSDSVDSIERLAGLAAKVLSDEDSDSD